MKINNCTLAGRLTKDVGLRKTTNGKDVAQFTLAVQDIGDTVDFINCEAWDKAATTIAQYCHKGDELSVTAKFRNRKENDEKYHPRFVVRDFSFGAKAKVQADDAFDTVDDVAQQKPLSITDDELPF